MLHCITMVALHKYGALPNYGSLVCAVGALWCIDCAVGELCAEGALLCCGRVVCCGSIVVL